REAPTSRRGALVHCNPLLAVRGWTKGRVPVRRRAGHGRPALRRDRPVAAVARLDRYFGTLARRDQHLVDIYEVHKIAVWYAYEALSLFKDADEGEEDRIQPLDILEAALQKRFAPRWNRQKLLWQGKNPELSLDTADITIDLIDSEAE